MSFAVGIFDLFAYLIPGSLYLTLFGYVSARVGWVDPAVVGRWPSLVLVVVVVLASYLLGYLAYPVGAAANRMVPKRRIRRPREEFIARAPAAGERDYVRADPFLLLAGVQLHEKDVANDVQRLRAAGLMLRNSAPPLALGFLAAVVELFAGPKPGLAAASAALLAAGSVSLIVQGRRLGHMASIKTLELSFWIPDIDEKFRDGAADGTLPT